MDEATRKGIIDSVFFLVNKWQTMANSRGCQVTEINKLSLEELMKLCRTELHGEIAMTAKAHWILIEEILTDEKCSKEFCDIVKGFEGSEGLDVKSDDQCPLEYARYECIRLAYGLGIGTPIDYDKALMYSTMIETKYPARGASAVSSVFMSKYSNIEEIKTLGKETVKRIEHGLKNGIVYGNTACIYSLGKVYLATGKQGDAMYLFDNYLKFTEKDIVLKKYRDQVAEYVESIRNN